MSTKPKTERKRHHKSHGFRGYVRSLIKKVMKLDKLCYRVDDSFKNMIHDILEIWIEQACDALNPMIRGDTHVTLTVKDARNYFKGLNVNVPSFFSRDTSEEKMSRSKRYGLILPVSRVRDTIDRIMGHPRQQALFDVVMTYGFQMQLEHVLNGFGAHHKANKGFRYTNGHLHMYMTEHHKHAYPSSHSSISGSRLGAFLPHTKSTEIKCSGKGKIGKRPSASGKKSHSKKTKKSSSGKGKKRKAPKKKESASIKGTNVALKKAEEDAKKTVVAVEHVAKTIVGQRKTGRVTKPVNRLGL